MPAMVTKKVKAKKFKKASSDTTASKIETPDFLPLEGSSGRDVSKIDDKGNGSTVLYIGRIPHGFYENEMKGFFMQFGVVRRLRIARNRKTGKSKHFGFIEFESPEVAQIVAECMHNYLMYEHMLQVRPVLPERVHPKLWKGANHLRKPVDWVERERKHRDKPKTLEQQQKSIAGVLQRDKKRQKQIEAAGIDYWCPEIVGSTLGIPKKIKFDIQ